MKLRVISVGRSRSDPISRAVDDYAERLSHYVFVEQIVVKEEPEGSKTPKAQILGAEAGRIQKAVPPKSCVVALDERGTPWSSQQLAEQLGRWMGDGRAQWVVLVIGGPSGLSPSLLKGANHQWSLSQLTLPHRLARLVVFEQLYRACTILRGERYHRA